MEPLDRIDPLHGPPSPEADVDVLRENELWYRTLVELSPDVIGVHCDGVLVFLNAAGAALVGAPDSEALLGQPLQSFIHPESLETFETQLRELEQGHSVPLTEYRISRLDGSTIYMEAAAAPVTFHGRPAVQFVARDITERKRAEDARLKSEQQYRQLVEQANDLIYRADALGFFTYANPVALRTLGYHEDEVIGRNYLELVHPDYREEAEAFYVHQRDEGIENTYYEFPVLTKDGQVVWLGQNVQLLREGEAVVGVQAVARIITERKRAQAELLEQRSLLRALVDNLPHYIYVKDRESRFQLMNQAVLKLLNVEHDDEVIGKTDFDLFPEALAQSFYAEEQEIFRTGRPVFNREAGVVHPRTGEQGWTLTTKVPVRDRTGEVAWIACVSQDITRRKQTEQALRESEAHKKAILEAIPDLIFRLSKDGTYLDVVAKEEHLLFRSAEELLGKRIAEVLPSELADRWAAAIARALERRELVLLEYELVTQDETPHAFEARIVPSSEDEVQATVRDITERRQAEQALRRYAERLELLLAIDQAILNAQSSRDIAAVALVQLRRLIPCERASIALFDHETDEVHLLAEQMPEGIILEDDKQLLASHIMVRADIREYGYALVPDLNALEDLPPVRQRLLEVGIRSVLNVALVVQGRTIGTLNLGALAPDAFSEEHVEIAREMASQLSLAIHSARLYEEIAAARERQKQLARSLVETQEKERRFLALELHDEIGQVLTALKLSLDIGDLPEEESGEAAPALRERLQSAKDLVEILTSTVRGLSLDLRPTMLDDLGLLPALLWYVRRYTEQTGVAVDFKHGGLSGVRLAGEVETAAYRIVQEALTNVARHAGVDEVEVQAWHHEDHLELQIADAGVGFDPEHIEGDAPTAGLSGIRERAALVGGRAAIYTQPGEGVQITAMLPLTPSEEP